MMSTFLQDLRFAIRTLKRRWMVTTLATLSLALAIGGNAAVFSLVDALEGTEATLRNTVGSSITTTQPQATIGPVPISSTA